MFNGKLKHPTSIRLNVPVATCRLLVLAYELQKEPPLVCSFLNSDTKGDTVKERRSVKLFIYSSFAFSNSIHFLCRFLFPVSLLKFHILWEFNHRPKRHRPKPNFRPMTLTSWAKMTPKQSWSWRPKGSVLSSFDYGSRCHMPKPRFSTY